VEDTNRILERKALRNVRALVDKLGRLDNPHEWRVVVLIAALVTVLAIVMWVSAHVYAARESAARERLSCQMEIWLEKSGRLERSLREADPNLSSREIQLQLKRERPFIMANAKIACDERAK
jgi:hypothetical protein